jgi:transcription antitermination factor NusA-like protein
MMGDIQEMMQRLESGSERARKRVAIRFPLLRARFQAASDAIPGMVDSVISGGRYGESLNSQWQQLLRTHGVTEATSWFVTAGRQDFEAELAEEVRVTTFDYEFTRPEGIDGLIDGYHDAESSASQKKYARAGIRTLGGAGTAALATWAIANWWNPTGWAAAAAVAVAVGSGLAGEAVARKFADDLERSTKADMYKKRGEIIMKLREQIWDDFHGVRSGCGDWLDKTKAVHLQIAHDVARPIQNSARNLWQGAVACLRHLDEITNRVNEGLIADIFSATVPECAAGVVQIESVIRSAGYRTKVIVSSTVGSRVSAMAACIGRKGQRIRQIRSAIGGEPIDLIDGQAPQEAQIFQALGLPTSEQVSVTLGERAGIRTVFVRFDAPYRASAVLGPRGENIRLAERLFGVNIVVDGVKL